MIEHLYQPKTYIDFCKSILLENTGGELILTTPYHGFLKNVVLALTGSMYKHFSMLRDGGHIKFWSKKTLGSLFKQRGFLNMEFKGCGRVLFL